MSAALLYAGKLATETAIGFVSYMSARQAAKADARIAGANARARYAAAQYEAAVQKRDAAQQYARELAAANNAYGAAGVATNSGTAAATADGLFESYKREIDEIGVRKSFAELEYGSTLATAKAKRKGATAGALLNFTAGVMESAADAGAKIGEKEFE